MCIDLGPPCRTKCAARCRALLFDWWSWLLKLSRARVSLLLSKLRAYTVGAFSRVVFIYLFIFTNQCVTIKERVSIWIMISTGAESKGKVSWSASRGFELSMHWLRIDLLMYHIHVSAVYFVWHFSHILMWFSLLLWQSSERPCTKGICVVEVERFSIQSRPKCYEDTLSMFIHR